MKVRGSEVPVGVGGCSGYVHGLTLELVDVTLFGKRAFADIIKDLEMRLPGWALIPMARALERQNKREDTGIPRRPGEDTGSYCSDATPGTPGATRSRKRQEGVSPRSSGVSTPCGCLHLGLRTVRELNFSCFKPRSLSKLSQQP